MIVMSMIVVRDVVIENKKIREISLFVKVTSWWSLS